jgi:ribbon-helix-helix protein
MKRLNFNIPDDLHTRLKVACALQQKDMTEILLQVIEEYLKKAEKKQSKK